jgi:ribosomal protein S18 acetylase RimI-like enzyme
MTIIIETAGVGDAEELLALQKLAYREPAGRYDDFDIPPMTQTLEQMREDLASHLYLKAIQAGRVVGAVRGRCQGGTCHIGRLIVHPEFQGQGLGQRLLREVEARFPEAQRCELFTGHLDNRNLHIYEKCGYVAFDEVPENDRLTLIYLEKRRGTQKGA